MRFYFFKIGESVFIKQSRMTLLNIEANSALRTCRFQSTVFYIERNVIYVKSEKNIVFIILPVGTLEFTAN